MRRQIHLTQNHEIDFQGLPLLNWNKATPEKSGLLGILDSFPLSNFDKLQEITAHYELLGDIASHLGLVSVVGPHLYMNMDVVLPR